MERFIGEDALASSDVTSEFKIQYGEIYRAEAEKQSDLLYPFKIQYGEIYRTLFLMQCSDTKII